jgi:hypothetical protein
VWIQSIQGRRFVVSMGPVPPRTSIGTRSQKALKMAMLACWSPTTLWVTAAIARPRALAYPWARLIAISSWQHSTISGARLPP